MANSLLELAKLVTRQAQVMNIMTSAIADQTSVLVDSLPKCTRVGCTSPATVTHRHLKGPALCDGCAARSIVEASHRMQSEPDSVLDAVRGQVASVDDWVDLPRAEQVRRLVAYSEALSRIDQADVSVH